MSAAKSPRAKAATGPRKRSSTIDPSCAKADAATAATAKCRRAIELPPMSENPCWEFVVDIEGINISAYSNKTKQSRFGATRANQTLRDTVLLGLDIAKRKHSVLEKISSTFGSDGDVVISIVRDTEKNRLLDDTNFVAACKYITDAVCQFIKRDDGDRKVKHIFGQVYGKVKNDKITISVISSPYAFSDTVAGMLADSKYQVRAVAYRNGGYE